MMTLESTHEEVLAEMERLRVLYALKQTLRYMSKRPDEHSESVAEHLFAMQVLALYFLPLEDPQGKLDRARINELILFHELGEIETGDIPFHKKNREHVAEEQRAAVRVSQRLPESMQQLALERSQEFEERKTPEALFAVAIDKLEPVFEMYEERVLPLFKRQQITRSFAVNVKREATKNFPYMRKFLDAWEARAVSLDIFPE
ncbi:MAG: HD domain-containing protein [Candidatus Pacebacteria bacterium]|nr:HD domain-containing protein [Candidatus Paceibacterota bacterium]